MAHKRKARKLPHAPRIKVGEIDYKKPTTFEKFLSESGKILPRRVTGASIKDQRRISKAVKNAREMALIPYYKLVRSEREK